MEKALIKSAPAYHTTAIEVGPRQLFGWPNRSRIAQKIITAAAHPDPDSLLREREDLEKRFEARKTASGLARGRSWWQP